jgi:hypothetical protein
MEVMVFLLFLFLFSGYIISLTSCQQGGAEQRGGASRAAEIADQAERNLATFNRAVAAAVLVAASLFAVYCVKRGSKTRRRQKTGVRRQAHRG